MTETGQPLTGLTGLENRVIWDIWDKHMNDKIRMEIAQPLTPAEETFVAILVRLERRLAEQKKREKNKAPAV